MSVTINPLPLDEIRALAEKDGSLYIMNYTDRGRQRNRGVFHMSATDESGQAFQIVIPNTWIPIDLSTYGSVKQLVKSQSFLNAFRTRDLIAISTEHAKSILRSAEAQEEAEKVNIKYNRTGSGISTETISITTSSSIDINNLPSQPSETAQKEEVVTASDMALGQLIDQFNKNQIGDAAAVTALLEISPPPQTKALQEGIVSITFTTSPFYMKLADLLATGHGEPVGGIADKVSAQFHQ